MTKAEYAEFQAAFELGTRGLTAISSGAMPGCSDCGLESDCSDHDRELAGESWFSWHDCHFCNRRLGGNRNPAHAVITEPETAHFAICDDCVYYLEYGKLDDSTMLDIEESAA